MSPSLNILSLGDTVQWRGAWGSDAPKPVRITGIDIVREGEKEDGQPVHSVPWEFIAEHPRRIVVTLSTGNWAYGHQVKPATDGDGR